MIRFEGRQNTELWHVMEHDRDARSTRFVACSRDGDRERMTVLSQPILMEPALRIGSGIEGPIYPYIATGQGSIERQHRPEV